MGYFRLSAATIAKAPSTSKMRTSEYSQLIANRNHAPPTAIMHKPKAIVLKVPRSYFCGLLALIPAKTSAQQPESTKTTGIVRVQPMNPAANSSIATTMVKKKTPMLKS